MRALEEFEQQIERVTGIQQNTRPPEWRAKLIIEEAIEADEAIRATNDLGQAPADLGAVAKELADCLYVVFGTARRFGIPIQQCFEVVHRSNMAKISEGAEFNAHGKLLKHAQYQAPLDEIREILDQGDSWKPRMMANL